MIIFLTHLEGLPLSASGVSQSPIIIPPSVLEPAYGVPSDQSMDPLVVWIFSYSNPQTLSVVPLFILISEYGISRLRVHHLSMLPSWAGSQLARFTIPTILQVQLCLLRIKHGLRDSLFFIYLGLVVL